MGADYSFYVKSIATYATAFLGYNNSVLARVKSTVSRSWIWIIKKKFVQNYHPKISLQRRWKGLMSRKYLMKSQNYIKIAIRRSKTLAQLWISFKIVVSNILLNQIKLNLDFSDQYHIKIWTQNVLLLLSYWKNLFKFTMAAFLCKKYLRQTSILGANE